MDCANGEHGLRCLPTRLSSRNSGLDIDRVRRALPFSRISRDRFSDPVVESGRQSRGLYRRGFPGGTLFLFNRVHNLQRRCWFGESYSSRSPYQPPRHLCGAADFPATGPEPSRFRTIIGSDAGRIGNAISAPSIRTNGRADLRTEVAVAVR